MDFEGFLKDVLTPMVDHPDALKIEVKGEGRKRAVWIHAEPGDRGRIIGKSGRMIQSLRTLCRAAADKAGISVDLELYEEERGEERA